MEQAAQLRALVDSRDVLARDRIVLWSGDGHRHKDIAELRGVPLPTVDPWKVR